MELTPRRVRTDATAPAQRPVPGRVPPALGATQISRVIDSKEAGNWEKRQKANALLGRHVDPAAEKTTVAAWCAM